MKGMTIIKPNSLRVRRILKSLELEDCKPAPTPWTKFEPEFGDDEKLDGWDYTVFRRCVGILQYLAIDRVDIGYINKELGRVASKPQWIHMRMLKRCARYLKGTMDFALVLRKGECKPTEMTVFCDSDWAGCRRTRKSSHCFVIMVGPSCVQFTVRAQSVIAWSSGEAEFYAAVSAAAESLCFGKLFDFWDGHSKFISIATLLQHWENFTEMEWGK